MSLAPNGATATRRLLSEDRPLATRRFEVTGYDLAATLSSGQAFRWQRVGPWWTSVIETHWVRLRELSGGLLAEALEPVDGWHWLRRYLQLDLDLQAVLETFPADEPMRRAVSACRGLRLLRQEPWECLASFILSSTKQIVQIQQIVSLLCARYGEPVRVPPNAAPVQAFPTAQRLAETTEAELRECKMGFRARYLHATARRIAAGEVALGELELLPVERAREALLQLPGVGRKIADCVLLFAYGRQEAFPVDVWVMKALRQLYFSHRRVKLERLHRFAATHFGPNAGYAQQYLFHYMRTGPPGDDHRNTTTKANRGTPG